MRLIDAYALINDVDGDLTDGIAEGRAIEKIMNAPVIEAVEVVRCKDCRKNPRIAWVGCPMAGMSQVFDEGYCHLGERRDE